MTDSDDQQVKVMAVTASDARRNHVALIERVNLDRNEIEIVSKRGSAVLMSMEE